MKVENNIADFTSMLKLNITNNFNFTIEETLTKQKKFWDIQYFPNHLAYLSDIACEQMLYRDSLKSSLK